MAEPQAAIVSIVAPTGMRAGKSARDRRLRKHADYQLVYGASRKHSSPSMSYFYAPRAPHAPSASDEHADVATKIIAKVRPVLPAGPRVGLTAGRVLGKAVDRNRIKRRMREAVRANIPRLTGDVDVILHPRRFVISMEYAKLEAEVGRIFDTVEKSLRGGLTSTGTMPPMREPQIAAAESKPKVIASKTKAGTAPKRSR